MVTTGVDIAVWASALASNQNIDPGSLSNLNPHCLLSLEFTRLQPVWVCLHVAHSHTSDCGADMSWVSCPLLAELTRVKPMPLGKRRVEDLALGKLTSRVAPLLRVGLGNTKESLMPKIHDSLCSDWHQWSSIVGVCGIQMFLVKWSLKAQLFSVWHAVELFAAV